MSNSPAGRWSPPRRAGRRPTAWPPPCPSTGRRTARPRRRHARSGSRRGSGGPGWAGRSRTCRGTRSSHAHRRRARVRAAGAKLSPDVAGRLRDLGEERFDPWPQGRHVPPESRAARAPGAAGAPALPAGGGLVVVVVAVPVPAGSWSWWSGAWPGGGWRAVAVAGEDHSRAHRVGHQVVEDVSDHRGGGRGAVAALLDDARRSGTGGRRRPQAHEPEVGSCPLALAVPVLPAREACVKSKPAKVR